jgi:hypothetical protein
MTVSVVTAHGGGGAPADVAARVPVASSIGIAETKTA